MPKATAQFGALQDLERAQIEVPVDRGSTKSVSYKTITLKILPEITDSKGSDYPDENIIGRSFPIKTYSHSGNRTIGMKVTFIVLTQSDILQNFINLRLLQSAAYPDDGTSSPYCPPPICRIRVGQLLTSQNDGWLCVVLKQYNTTFDTSYVWDETTYLPYKISIDLSWDVVFDNQNLPGQSMIFGDVPS